MSNSSPIIVGAGISGLLAAVAFPTATVFEEGPQGHTPHRALLRFRSDAVANFTGIDFRRVRVHKGVWSTEKGAFVPPSIRLANQYALKVSGRVADRSIWHLDPVDRWVAPEDFTERLLEKVRDRVEFNTPYDFHHVLTMARNGFPQDRPIISTIPMSQLSAALLLPEFQEPLQASRPAFSYAGIQVRRWRLHGADTFQTVYFPEPDTTLYRASITKDLLIAEYAGPADNAGSQIFDAFGLERFSNHVEALDTTQQRYGKIAPLPDDHWRREFIHHLTARHNIFSLGRYATWRNILIDDVLQDIRVIKSLLGSDAYTRRLRA